MIVELYSIKDELNEYTTPIPLYDERQAKRYFKDQCEGGNPFMTRNKEDFSLVYLGKFNTDTGTIDQDKIKIIMKGEEANVCRENNTI